MTFGNLTKLNVCEKGEVRFDLNFSELSELGKRCANTMIEDPRD
jgi:hypothetical protein